MSDNVVEFDLKVKEQKHGVKKEKSFNRCRHNKKLADTHLQQLECADCGKIFTAWDYVLSICKSEQRLFDHVKYAKIERQKLEDELLDLKRKIRNAKSQLSRAK